MRDFIPADTIDANGKVWDTVGENIRDGAKKLSFSESDVKEIIDILFPVGSIYTGENSIITSVGTWEPLSDGINKPFVLASAYTTGVRVRTELEALESATGLYGVVLRAWKRVA